MSRDEKPPKDRARERNAARAGSACAEQDDVDYGHRHFINLLSAALLLVLAIGMVWTVRAIDQQETTRKCFASGRKDCVTVAAPPHDMRQAVR